METDWSSLHKILSDSTRRSILELLAEKETLSYTDIMTLLRVTNTGRLNYHLKVLGNLISKDEGGRYQLTEQGRLAVNLLKTFPERAPAEKKLSALKMAVAAVLIIAGVFLIITFLIGALAFASTTPTASSNEQVSVSSQTIPKNTTVYLTGWASSGGQLGITWSASAPVHVYVLNQSEWDALQLQHPTSGQTALQNFTGLPTSWVDAYYLQSGNVSPNLSQGQYYFLAGSQSQALVGSFGLSQSQTQPSGNSSESPFLFLYVSVFIAIGILLEILAASILTKRIWR